jgi:hypothetical protein
MGALNGVTARQAHYYQITIDLTSDFLQENHDEVEFGCDLR